MLQLKNIKKDYITGDTTIKALKGINIEFRENEFVSVLGQSGCGKTTLLNIVGGLDRYTSGDLAINGKSTKEFKDGDWDTYRNHSVGFVFQSYNLIGHQTVLSNVELALTISGISKEETRERAIKVLEKVGLGDQLHKKPNQMSGGQMQRVAIARALVNDPDILLADEPTGALDSTTSVQIMEMLKEIAKDRLIIMVTHNSEIAEKYSSRIIKLLDGEIIDDSNPYTATDAEKKNSITRQAKTGKASMSFKTALQLSLNNLMTKKARTFLTAFAGSIGIIGIALILSLSNGVQKYISKVEEDTLSSYPIAIEETTMDMSAMISTFMDAGNSTTTEHTLDKVYTKNIMSDMVETLSSKIQANNLKAFKEYLESGKSDITKYSNAIQYKYKTTINVYKTDTTDEIFQVHPSKLLSSLGMGAMTGQTEDSSSTSLMSSSMITTDIWEELLDNEDLLKSQYNVLAGSWPKEYNEVVLMVDDNNEISDYTLYSLGLKSTEELAAKVKELATGIKVESFEDGKTYSYDELINISFKLLLSTDYYKNINNTWTDMRKDKTYMSELIKNAEDIKIVGIIRANEESVTTPKSGFIGYTRKLTETIMNKTNETEIAKAQIENKNINVFTGLVFETDGTDTYTTNLEKLGIANSENPSTINIYPTDFESKDKIKDLIEQYNIEKRNAGDEADVISYSDLVGTLMSSVTSIIDVISYVLIAFVGISLVVSSIMIGIITYISVLERTKEIGVLRSMGASKKDISRVFNAETLIVGFVAGALGIIITLILNIPINMIIKSVVGISGIAVLPVIGGIVLILISVILTMFAGLIPARVAAKKDPVEALRTE